MARRRKQHRNYDPYDPPRMTAAERRQFEKEVAAMERRTEQTKHHMWQESRHSARPFGPKQRNGALMAGALGGPGYAKKPRRERHRVLRESVERDSYATTAKRLQVLLNLGGKTQDAATLRVLQGDKEWLARHYSGAHAAAPSTAPVRRLARAPSVARAANPPGIFMANAALPMRANHHLTVGQRARYLPLTGVFCVVLQAHPNDRYDVRWETTGVVQPDVDGARLAPA